MIQLISNRLETSPHGEPFKYLEHNGLLLWYNLNLRFPIPNTVYNIRNTTVAQRQLAIVVPCPSSLFMSHLYVINSELDQLHAKKTDLILDLREDNAEPVSYEVVRFLLQKFDKLLDTSSFDQRKMLMHLVIKQITIKDTRTIDQIEMNFDENTVHHFLTADPSATHAEGSFAVQMKRGIQGQQISIAI